MDDATEDIEEQSEQATGILDRLRERFESLEETYPILSRLRGVLAPVAALFLGGLGIKAVISLVKSLSSEFFNAAMAAETLERSIIFSSRNLLEGAKNLKFVSDAARDLDLNVSSAQKNYANLIAAATNAYKVWRNKYQESYQDIDKLTQGLQGLKEAWQAANKAQIDYRANCPVRTTICR